MRRSARESRRVSVGTIQAARALIPPSVLRTGRCVDIGDSALNGSLGMPTRLALPVSDFSSTLAWLHSMRDESADVVLMLDCVYGFSWLELQAIFSQTRRVLKDRGTCVLTWDSPAWHRIKRRFGRSRREKDHAWGRREILTLLRMSGFMFGGSGLYAFGVKRWAWATK